MAVANEVVKTNTKVVTTEETIGVTLELTLYEARVLLRLMREVSGATVGPRGQIENIMQSMMRMKMFKDIDWPTFDHNQFPMKGTVYYR